MKAVALAAAVAAVATCDEQILKKPSVGNMIKGRAL
jgi:hypothetical protein